MIRSLGYEVDEGDDTISPEQRKQILQQLASGDISSEQAVELLKAK